MFPSKKKGTVQTLRSLLSVSSEFVKLILLRAAEDQVREMGLQSSQSQLQIGKVIQPWTTQRGNLLRMQARDESGAGTSNL
jgi:hypothetical protein